MFDYGPTVPVFPFFGAGIKLSPSSCKSGVFMLVVHTTFASRRTAEAAAQTLVKENLSACATVFPAKSFYIWKGKLAGQREFVLELKIKGGNYKKVERRLRQLHAYVVPQIIAFEVKRAGKDYAAWVEKA